MTIRLLTESAARREWAGEMLVVREDRDLLSDIALFCSRVGAVLLLIFPLWRPNMPVIRDISWLWLVPVAALLLWHSWRIAEELKAVRAPTSWLMAASRDRVWLHLRSYLHREWPKTHKTVLAFDRSDIEVIHGVRIARSGGPPQMAIRLNEPLTAEAIDALMDENTRMEKGRFGYTRHNHEPIRLEEDGQTLRVMFGQNRPAIGQALDKLRLNYPVDPPRSVPDSEAYLLPSEMQLTEAIVAKAAVLVKDGKKLDAIRYLHRRAGLSLRDSKSVVDQLS